MHNTFIAVDGGKLYCATLQEIFHDANAFKLSDIL